MWIGVSIGMGCRLEESIQESSQAQSSFLLDLVTSRHHAPRNNVSIQARLAVPIEAYSQTYLSSRLQEHCSFIPFMLNFPRHEGHTWTPSSDPTSNGLANARLRIKSFPLNLKNQETVEIPSNS
jgi:hypothetical protein